MFGEAPYVVRCGALTVAIASHRCRAHLVIEARAICENFDIIDSGANCTAGLLFVSRYVGCGKGPPGRVLADGVYRFDAGRS